MKRAPSKKRASKASGNSCLLGAGCICLLFLGLVSLQLYQGESSFPALSSLMGRLDQEAVGKYEEVLRRARELTLRYRNMTAAALPPHIQTPAGLSHDNQQPQFDKEPPASVLPVAKFNQLLEQQQQQRQQPPPTGSTMTDVVIGMAQDTDAKNLVVFCASLRKVSSADVVIFVNTPIPPRHQEIADKNKVKLVPFELQALSADMQVFHPSTLRWPLIFRFFQSSETRAKYKRVWMADVRDAAFQGDPFKMLPLGTRGFYAFQGVETVAIKDCGWNAGWVRDCFGPEVLARIGSNKIICSGVSMGDMQSVFAYLQLMDDVIMARAKSATSQGAKFPQCERNGVDQGLHNVLVHERLIPNLKIWSHSDGPVANLQAQKSRINNGQVFNQVGDAVAVVHQYDRRPDLQKALFAAHVYWIDTNDVEAEWAAESACQAFTTKASDVDLYKGMCDLKSKGGATSAASCCAFCLKQKSCKAFTFYSSVCFLKSCTVSKGAAALPGSVSAGMA